MVSQFNFIQDEATRVGDAITAFAEKTSEFHKLTTTPTVTPLTDRGVIAACGPDVFKLLQGQLTCDINQLAEFGSLKGALCDSKGRMVSNFICIYQDPDTVLLVMPAELVEPTLATLKKYAVFYKVTLTDSSDRFHVCGVHHPSELPSFARPGQISDQLALVLFDNDQAESGWRALAETRQPTGINYWDYLRICAGEGEVKQQTQGEFIPQMLNLQLTNAINFRKGCYTGQEIVARMQYLGKLKRRMYHLHLETEMVFRPGDVINLADKASVGTVVMASPTGDMLAVLTEEAIRSEILHIADYSGRFSLIPLPYESAFSESNQ